MRRRLRLPSPSILMALACVIVALDRAPTISAAAATDAVPYRLKPEGVFTFDVRDAANGEAIPCKVTFVGVGGSPDPAFTRDDIGRQEDNAITAYDRIMSLSGIGGLRVPLGTYDVTISRGPTMKGLACQEQISGDASRGGQLGCQLG